MNIEDDEGPDPDYGVFGDNRPQPPRKRSEKELQEIRKAVKRRDREIETSRSFNRYMIDLYNQSQKK